MVTPSKAPRGSHPIPDRHVAALDDLGGLVPPAVAALFTSATLMLRPLTSRGRASARGAVKCRSHAECRSHVECRPHPDPRGLPLDGRHT